MDVETRGILETLIDNFVTGTEPMVEGVKLRFGPIIENPEDFTLGWIIGNILGSFGVMVSEHRRKRLSDEEMEEAFSLLEKRAPEIKDSVFKTQ